jgi:hypothetical protein
MHDPASAVTCGLRRYIDAASRGGPAKQTIGNHVRPSHCDFIRQIMY